MCAGLAEDAGTRKSTKAPVWTYSCAFDCTGVHMSERPGLACIYVAVKARIPVPPVNLPPHQCEACLPVPFSFEHIF